jgi:alanyl-tRNA synthetase
MTFTSADIRNSFLQYFGRHGHEIVPASPLIPHNDPSLLFVNSGMVQFKNVFTGQETKPYSRATTVQKCIRAGGKHNDLENVGYTARHHTFFEMLGNFSFGDYFKADAIPMAWELLTKDLGINPDKLCVTVYSEDDEAATLWKKVANLPDHKIIRIATTDNFWSMGDTGPCGPCSEIFYDHGDSIPGGPPGSPDQDGDRFVEIWNLVFMQYEQHADGKRTNLPKPSIDTGMGLERVAAVLQGVHNNYDTDIMQALIQASMNHSNADDVGAHKFSHRVIADHMRSSGFLIADGVLPSNEGRGYVLRRIMRRAMRHAHLLGAQDLLMHKLVPTLVDKMGHAYPELQRAQALMTETLHAEEGRFKATLDRGLKFLDEETNRLSNKGTLAGDIAFKLYDTYGFPLDLTQDILKSKGMHVDTAGFETAMDVQKKAARAAWSGSGEQKTSPVWFDILDATGPTEFLGYTSEKGEGQILALVEDGKQLQEAKVGKTVSIITNQTPFYAESGGQMGDTGTIKGPKGKGIIKDTIKMAGQLHAHVVDITEGTLHTKDMVHLQVDTNRRTRLRANHSATHMLDAALRKHFGDVVVQKGSLVAPDRLRFDFSFGRGLTTEELQAITDDINDHIRQNLSVHTVLMTPEAAIKAGAIAMFGEKYGEEVRVVSMGDQDASPYSMELCGGTHVRRSGDIGLFKIINESSVAAGVRRIEAVTGKDAEDYIAQEERALQETAALLKAGWRDLPKRVQQLMEDRKRLEKELSQAKQQGAGALEEMPLAGGGKFYWQVLPDSPAKDLRSRMDGIKQKISSGVVLLVATEEDKVSAVVGVTGDLTSQYNAQDLIKVVGDALGAKGGGGRPDLAQCGSSDVSLVDKAVEALKWQLEG